MANEFYTLITGASEGFGKALAIECAKRNYNLILVALPGIELYELKSFINSNYKVQVVVFEKDLCEENACHELFEQVMRMDLRVNMLFNNAGTGSTGFFSEGNVYAYERQIKLNVLATTLISRLFVDSLKKNSPAYILNVGSLASFFPLPKKQVYGATKSFIYYFSKCLQEELKNEQVYVSTLCPGPMKTNRSVTSLIEQGNWFIRNSSFNPETIAPQAIDGLLRKKKVMVPGKLNNCYILIFTLLPDFLKSLIAERSTRKLNSAVHTDMVLGNSFAASPNQFTNHNFNKTFSNDPNF